MCYPLSISDITLTPMASARLLHGPSLRKKVARDVENPSRG